MVVGGSFKFMPKPSYLPWALSWLARFVAVLYIVIGDEWGSVWCWVASCLVLLCVIEPALFRRYRVFDADVLDSSAEAEELRQTLGGLFYLARIHYLPEMLPWSANGIVQG